jgi:hypothetical protein
MSRTFDPAIETQKLRDHLASHDKPIAFLFGAGTSAAVEGTDAKPLVPAIAELTRRCAAAAEALGDPYKAAWLAIVDSLPDDRRTIEDILSAVRQMHAAILPGDELGGLDKAGLEALEAELQRAISREARPAETRFPAELPHRALARWIGRIERASAIEIFTTNYDTLFERALEEEWVPLFDGFVGAYRPFFSPASLAREPMAPGRRWVRLWKIHGSVTWALAEVGGTERIVRGREQESGELILPSLRKYEESRKQPYVAVIDRLHRFLSDREDAILVTCGYSFGDEHINEVVFDALDANPRLHVFALCHSNPAVDSQLSLAAGVRTNIVILARTMAVVGGVQGTWELQDPALLETRLDGIFEKNGTGASGATLTGELRLGDFNALCRLFSQIVGPDA